MYIRSNLMQLLLTYIDQQWPRKAPTELCVQA